MFGSALRSLLLLAVSTPAFAQSKTDDPHARAGMDAEVRGQWIRAVEAFQKSAGEKPNNRQRERLRFATRRATAYWKQHLGAMIKAKRYDELPLAVALARLVIPNDSTVKRAAGMARAKGLTIPVAPPADKNAVKEFPTRTLGARMRRWTPEIVAGEAIIDRALDWLVKTQEEKGFWDAKKHGSDWEYDDGVTGLALLALLARGPGGLAGARGEAAHKAAAHLLAAQKESGAFNTRMQHGVYISTIATEALAEYAVIANKRKETRAALERARDYLVDMQRPGSGWRYERNPDPADTCVTWRVVCALDRLRRTGIEVPAAAFDGGARFAKSMTDKEYGQIGYNMPGGSPARPEGLGEAFPPEQSQSMTAAGCLIQLYAGRVPKTLPKSLLLLDECRPIEPPDMYYWALGARAWQAARGYVPATWYGPLVEIVRKCANDDGGVQARGPWGRDGGRVYATAICVLALAAPYREQPAMRPSNFRETGKHTVMVSTAQPSGVYVDKGDVIKVVSWGQMVAWSGGPRIGPAGCQSAPRFLKRIVKKGRFGCLLAHVGPEGKPFVVKDGTFRVKVPGQLFFLVNDTNPGDNKGRWTVNLELLDEK